MNWNPKPRRPTDPNPLFTMDESYEVQKSLTPIQRQRLEDGTPHTKCRPSALSAKDYTLYLGEEPVSKGADPREGQGVTNTDPPLMDPDQVVKSFLAKADLCSEEDEDTAKGTMGEAVARTAGSAAKTATKVATGVATRVNSAKG